MAIVLWSWLVDYGLQCNRFVDWLVPGVVRCLVVTPGLTSGIAQSQLPRVEATEERETGKAEGARWRYNGPGPWAAEAVVWREVSKGKDGQPSVMSQVCSPAAH